MLTSNEIAQFALAPILSKFNQLCPKAALYIEATSRHADLIGEGFDVEIRACTTPLKDSTLLQRVIARTPWSLAAAREYLEARQAPTEPPDLIADQLLCFGLPNDEHVWELQHGNVLIPITLKPAICCNDMVALRIAAIHGRGIVGLPIYLIDSCLKQGQLVPVLPDWRLSGPSISIIMPPKRQSSRLATRFIDFIATELPLMTHSFGSPTLSETESA